MSEERVLKQALEERGMNEIEDPILKALSFLYDSYELKFWWFEVFETLRKERTEAKAGAKRQQHTNHHYK